MLMIEIPLANESFIEEEMNKYREVLKKEESFTILISTTGNIIEVLLVRTRRKKKMKRKRKRKRERANEEKQAHIHTHTTHSPAPRLTLHGNFK